MGINALEVSENMKNTYINYLSTTFEFENKEVMNSFVNEMKKKDFIIKGPILEITSTFKKGKSLLELVNENLLSKEFTKIESLPIKRPLYLHQEKAIKKILNNRNIIVSTGTGSGKTESFLIPILNYLFRQKEEKVLGPGVRALVLYPMNALASDQLKRLRKILKDYPEITFGSYTGETPEYYENALAEYKRVYNQEPLPNELISREQMKKTPPNILITNYSMLEYLLLRLEDNTLFSGEFGKTWKYIVIDEAHMYSGAKGIEISMLLRRLQVEIDKLNKDLQFILTSASLGSGVKDYPKIAEFGQKLCSSPFQKEDIIESEKMESVPKEYLNYPISIYHEIALELRKNSELKRITDILDRYEVEYDKNCSDINEILFDVFYKDERIFKIKKLLKDKYYSLEKAAFEVEANLTVENLIDIIEITNKAQKNDEVLIPGKYHMFFRSLEGAYITFKPSVKVHLTPQEVYNYGGKDYRAFEIGVCQNCKKMYLIGKEEVDEEGFKRIKIVKNYMEDLQDVNYYLIDDLSEKYEVEDEDSIDEKVTLRKNVLCTCCGRISETLGSKICNCGKENYITVTKVESEKKNNSGKLHKCISCGKVSTLNSIVRKIVAGNEASTSVLLDSLYKNIGENSLEKIDEINNSSEDYEDINKYFDFMYEDNEEEPKVEEEEKGKNKKQILVFSDSRQNAAYFAGYFKFTYNKLLRRQLLIDVLKENGDSIENYYTSDLVQDLAQKFEMYYKKTSKEAKLEAWKMVLYEFMGIDGKNGLEDIGILTYKCSPELTRKLKNPLEKFGLSKEDLATLIDIFCYGVRKIGAVYDDKISREDWKEYFTNVSKSTNFLKVRPIVDKEESKKYNGIKGWIPTRKDTNLKAENQRSEFLKKIGVLDTENKFLEALFNLFVDHNIFKKDKTNGYKLNMEKFKVKSCFDKDYKYYQCNKCKKITPYNIKNKCSIYKCDGELEEINIFEVMKNNHYWKMYMDSDIQSMEIAEHTAQLAKDEARKKQTDFINGNINILSCSTTFEVGVDVGELETVFMRNVPPTPANYVQRAGRAGRRNDSTAFAVTYSSLKSHDFINFEDPSKMISGKIAPPVFEVENYKIVRRHLFATILSEFWKKNKNYYGKNFGDFVKEGERLSPFKTYIKSKDKSLIKKLENIIPSSMSNIFELENLKWLEELTSDERKGLLDEVTEQFYLDIKLYEEKLEELWKNKQTDKIHYLHKNLNLMRQRKLIEVLSRGNIIPRYGFPVDTVNLEVEDVNINLSRDLQQALTDYVPDSEVVANGKVFKSRYVKQVPDKALDRYEYRICDNCKQITRVKKFLKDNIEKCSNCGYELKKNLKNSSEYQIPIFGFIAENQSKEATTSKPQRAGKIEKFYVGNLDSKNKIVNIDVNNHMFELHFSKKDKMAVIGMGKGFGFLICPTCGYGEVINDISEIKFSKKYDHKTHYGKKCTTYLQRTDLGYEFETDVVLINTSNLDKILVFDEHSILYAVLEGISRALSIERTDIDGCFYGIDNKRFLVIYDRVPGGAGHCKRLLEGKNLEKSLLAAYSLVKNCKCGEDTACYSCLKNYNNQWYHEKLARIKAISFFENIFG